MEDGAAHVHIFFFFFGAVYICCQVQKFALPIVIMVMGPNKCLVHRKWIQYFMHISVASMLPQFFLSQLPSYRRMGHKERFSIGKKKSFFFIDTSLTPCGLKYSVHWFQPELALRKITYTSSNSFFFKEELYAAHLHIAQEGFTIAMFQLTWLSYNIIAKWRLKTRTFKTILQKYRIQSNVSKLCTVCSRMRVGHLTQLANQWMSCNSRKETL